MQAAVPKEPSLGEKTIRTKDANGNTVTIRQPLKPGDADAMARQAIQTQHDQLEASVNAKSGKAQDPAEIAQLNSLKAKLGYKPIGDAATTAPVVPVTATDPAQANVAQPQAAATTPVAPVVDRTALAKQALDDPNASEDHKVAARKILGL